MTGLEREVREAEAHLLEARTRREAAVVAAVAAGESYRKVAGWLGHDHSSVYQIVQRAKRKEAARR